MKWRRWIIRVGIADAIYHWQVKPRVRRSLGM